MSMSYSAVQWNRHKRIYDAILAVVVIAFIVVFVIAGMATGTGERAPHIVTLLMRATSTVAITLLTVILAIGPLARLSPKFNVLLYNRRHLGVTMFLVAFVHGALAMFWYHGFGVVSPIKSILVSNANYLPMSGQSLSSWLAGFPFQPLGLFALVILFLMAATSHDFWLKNLSPRIWKNLHTLVYVAYALVVMHVTLGFMQDDVSPIYAVLLFGSVLVIAGLHLVAGHQESQREDAVDPNDTSDSPWVDIGAVSEIPEDRARTVCLQQAERIAVFRHDGKISAISNVCAHQNGPLGEGKIVDGCVTCPWHGYQYHAHNGQSPPPFTEKVPTYRVCVKGDRVLVDPNPLPPGTPVEPAVIVTASTDGNDALTGATRDES